MEINWLKDFIALAATQNFSRAAELRYVSQPAFSRRIRALEAFVGARLINRDTLPLSLTPAGELFLERSETLLRSLEDALEQCRLIEVEDENVLRIAASQSLYTSYNGSLIEPFVERGLLTVELDSVSWPAGKFVGKMQQGNCDLMLCYWHPSMGFLSSIAKGQFDYVTIAKESLLPVSKPDENGAPLFRLPNGGKSRVPLISYGSASVLRPVVDEILASHSGTASTLLVSQNALSNSVMALIQEGFGLGWLPTKVCADAIEQNTLVHAGDESFIAPLEIRLYRSRQNQKPKLKALWSEVVAKYGEKT
ncbi:DNA-binding transcriptional LysR family regulator [Pacificibacter maritimus]|uniref:DNA-binding transcriptional LysR family regulator n=1 Tax=Pacificibacter maritimus TaxID=762213 RepID=A0A3N4V107_9RHOB|nr:LysR family transcriptional regulator [Pacificibacter maritimus]RPE66594.1 DNA-binding transcriptional LysR family regulator [Pacificibacter maritimus]